MEVKTVAAMVYLPWQAALKQLSLFDDMSDVVFLSMVEQARTKAQTSEFRQACR
jgi:hypothetical protein